MRKLVGIPMVLSLMVLPGSFSEANAGASISVSVQSRPDYVACDAIDMDWDNMIVMENDRVGYWVMLPSGRWVFRCRAMWYDNGLCDWRFGPWWDDFSISYSYYHSRPHLGIGFHVYMNEYYPRWHVRHFDRHHDRWDSKHSHKRARKAAHCEYNYSRYQHDRPVVLHKESIERGNHRTTVVVREENRPVRVDGRDRVDQGHHRNRGSEITPARIVTRESDAGRVTTTRRSDVNRESRRW